MKVYKEEGYADFADACYDILFEKKALDHAKERMKFSEDSLELYALKYMILYMCGFDKLEKYAIKDIINHKLTTYLDLDMKLKWLKHFVMCYL